MDNGIDHAARLRPRWRELCERLGVAAEQQEKWWAMIEGRYIEPHRHYHTLEHLSELLEHLDAHRSAITDVDAVSLAIFFHDIVYEPKAGSPKNEQDSAILFDFFGQEALPPGSPLGLTKGALIAKVRTWILQTASHKVSDEDEQDCKLFMDFDMAILGTPWERYDKYSQQVRSEYCHVPEAVFCKARSAFLASCALDAAPVFASAAFRRSHEMQAKENMAREASLLSDRFAACSLASRKVADLVLSAAAKKLGAAAGCGLAALAVLGVVLWRPVATLGSCCLGTALSGLYLACGARYERHPYQSRSRDSRIAVLAGSYNPPHLGHLEMLKHLSKVHVRVVAIIGINPDKRYDVSPYQRQELLRAMLKEICLSNVEVVVWPSIIFLYARSIGARVMYRGIRSWREDGLAEKHLEFLNLAYQLYFRHFPIPTAYLQGAPSLSHVSSTLLRKRLAAKESIADLVPEACAESVKQAYGAP